MYQKWDSGSVIWRTLENLIRQIRGQIYSRWIRAVTVRVVYVSCAVLRVRGTLRLGCFRVFMTARESLFKEPQKYLPDPHPMPT